MTKQKKGDVSKKSVIDGNQSMTHKDIKEMLQMPDDDPDIVFLSSSLNNMLVSGTLKGINLSLLST